LTGTALSPEITDPLSENATVPLVTGELLAVTVAVNVGLCVVRIGLARVDERLVEVGVTVGDAAVIVSVQLANLPGLESAP